MIRKGLSIALLLLLVLSMLPARAAAEAGGSVTMAVSVGYDGKYVVGRIAPVTVTVRNDGKEIAGTLELRTGDAFSLLVRREVILPQNTEKQFVLYVMASNICKPKDFEVVLRQGGSAVATAVPKAATGVDPSKSLCGILSDDPASVGYLKKILFEQSYLKDWIELTADGLYDNAQLLDSFCLIAMDGLDGAALTEKQFAALRQWVCSGGTLILGTGPGGEPAAGWQELTGGLTFQGAATATGLGRLSSLAQGKELGAALPVLAMQSGDGWIENARAEDGKPLVLSRSAGKGAVYVAAFRLGEGVIGSWQGANLLWMSLLNGGVYSSAKYGQSTYYGGYYGPYGGGGEGIRQALQQGTAGGGTTFLLFLAVLIAFVALAGFVGFLILKAMGRQKLMWVYVPAVAVLTSGVLLFFGSSSLGRKPYLFAFTSTDISGAVCRSERTLGFVSPAFGKYKVAVDGASMLYPQSSIPYDYYGYSGPSGNPVKMDITAVTNADGADIEFLNVNMNGTRMVKFNTFSQRPPLEYSFEYDGKAVNCVLRNTSEWTIEDATAMIGMAYHTVDSLAPGEAAEFTLRLDQTPPDQSLWNIMDKLYPYSYGGMSIFAMKVEDRRKSLKGAFLREQVNTFINGMPQSTAGLAQAYCFGWVDRAFEHAVTVNGRAVVPQTMEFISAFAPVEQTGEGIEVAKAYAKLSPIQTSNAGVMLKDIYLTVEPSTNAVLDFDMSAAQSIVINDMFFEAGNRSGANGGKWSFFNWSTGMWDFAVPSQAYGKDSIASYINAEGTVRMRISTGVHDYFDGAPYVWVQGVKK